MVETYSCTCFHAAYLNASDVFYISWSSVSEEGGSGVGGDGGDGCLSPVKLDDGIATLSAESDAMSTNLNSQFDSLQYQLLAQVMQFQNEIAKLRVELVSPYRV